MATSLGVESSHADGRLSVTLSGFIDSETAPQFEERMESELRSGTDGGVVLDMGRVEYINSTGLRVILVSAKTLSSRGHKLSIVNVGSSVMEIMESAGLTRIIAVSPAASSA